MQSLLRPRAPCPVWCGALTSQVRAEDGRAVTCVDISPFIDHLPFGKRTTRFSTEDASGSTSQAAAIIEALEGGAQALLLDEDTSATNFMIRDARMQALVAADREPIRPFITRVRSLWTAAQVSTILVGERTAAPHRITRPCVAAAFAEACNGVCRGWFDSHTMVACLLVSAWCAVGGSGDYFDVADTVLLLDEYKISDATAQAKAIAQSIAGGAPPESKQDRGWPKLPKRRVGSSGLEAGMKTAATRSSIRFGEQPELDLSGVEQIVEHSQVSKKRIRCTARALS
jgi:hypothetical protein